MPDVDLTAIAASLYARRATAVTAPYVEHCFATGPASEKECHNNADRFALENPGHTSIHGWLVFDFHRTSLGIFRFCRFTEHSVLEGPDGRMFDITPSPASQRYPFLRHHGPEGEFEAIVLAGHVHLDHHILPD